uniref:Uncharacterized protein n=1 Tax=Anguilla anguilla TaxID=7936 RepID=A0A0E9Q2R9_ANGAN
MAHNPLHQKYRHLADALIQSNLHTTFYIAFAQLNIY